MSSAYRRFLSVWPDQIPGLSKSEARTAFKRLWKIGTGEAWSARRRKLVFGRRWGLSLFGATINEKDGWTHLAWYVGHWTHGTRDPVMFSIALAKEIIDRGWLTGKLERVPREKTKPPVQIKRYQNVVMAIDRWTRKKKLAETKLKNLRVKLRYYEKAIKNQQLRTNVVEFVSHERAEGRLPEPEGSPT